MDMIFLFDENDIAQTKDGSIGLLTRSIIWNGGNMYRMDIKDKTGWYHKYLLEKDLAIHIPSEGRSREEMKDLLLVISKLS